MGNTVITDNEVEVYENRIMELADEYIDTLRNPDDIYNSNTFTGLIKYINRKYLRAEKENIIININILNDIWEMYVELVYKYNQKPIIEEFAILLGINRDTIYSWMKGETRNDYCDKLGSSRSDTVKKWQEECRVGRYKSAASGNVGGIFLCKAVDGMVETAPVQVENKAQVQSIEEIQARYGVGQSENPMLEPPKADF